MLLSVSLFCKVFLRLYHHSEWNLTSPNPNGCVVKLKRISASVLFMPYSKLYILTELSANDVKFISRDGKELDLSKYI